MLEAVGIRTEVDGELRAHGGPRHISATGVVDNDGDDFSASQRHVRGPGEPVAVDSGVGLEGGIGDEEVDRERDLAAAPGDVCGLAGASVVRGKTEDGECVSSWEQTQDE